MGGEERIRTNITLSKEVFNRAVDYHITLCQLLENQLLNYFSMRKQVFNIQYIPDTHSTYLQQSQKQQKTHVKNVHLYGIGADSGIRTRVIGLGSQYHNH